MTLNVLTAGQQFAERALVKGFLPVVNTNNFFTQSAFYSCSTFW